MPEKLTREYKQARTIARFGAALLYLAGAVSLVIAALHFAELLSSGQPSELYLTQRHLSFLSAIIMAGSITTLAEFLRHFSKGNFPFGRSQSLRLLIASALFVLRCLLDALTPTTNLSIGTNSITLMTPDPQFTVDLKVVVMIVFLACLAMVIRYGDALKEDSDAFI